MRIPTRIAFALAVLLAAASESRADLGVLVADGVRGPYRISVLASPAPLRAGRSRWNVLVQDGTGASVEEARIELSFRLAGDAGSLIQSEARPGTHPFYRSSEVTLPEAANWQVAVNVHGPEASASLGFEVRVSPRAGPWREFWPALLAPLIAIGLFAVHQSLALHRRRTEA